MLEDFAANMFSASHQVQVTDETPEQKLITDSNK